MKYKEFKKLAEKHLTILEGYEVDKKGNTKKQIYGLEKLHKAITVTHCCKSDSELLKCGDCDCKVKYPNLGMDGLKDCKKEW